MPLRLSLIGSTVAILLLCACGPRKEVIDPVSWPFLESTENLVVNGAEFDAYIAITEIHRRRAIHGLGVRKGRAIAMLYPDRGEPVTLEFRNSPDPVDLVFIGNDGKALSVERVPAFSEANFPRKYGGKHARVVLQLPEGKAAELNINVGSEVKTSPDLIEKSEKAEPPYARAFFLRNVRAEDRPVDSPSVALKVLEKPEDVARLVKDRDEIEDGEGVIVPLGGAFHEFWLKEARGRFSACYIERPARGGLVVSSIFEGIEDSGDSDIARPVYYSTGEAQYLIVIKSPDFFSSNRIERRSPVTISGVDGRNAEKITYDDLEIRVGASRLMANLAHTAEAREYALRNAGRLEPGKGVVLAWDDPSFVRMDAPAGANLWFVSASGGRYAVAERHRAEGGPVGVRAPSRFVLLVPDGFDAEGELTLPYRVRDLKPLLPPVLFYTARTADVVTDRWPGESESLKGLARVELAITDAEQRRGLMFRESLKPDHGMLFIYDREQPNLSFWMKNCRMNLSSAFVNDRGVIVRIHNVMTAPAPGTPDHLLESYPSGLPARYVIEMEENWFKERGIVEGDRVFIPPRLTASGQ